jgi:IgGFc binding protein
VKYSALAGGVIPPDQVPIAFLAESGTLGGDGACPAGVTPAYLTDPSVRGTALGQAFHVTASAPVVAYDIYPYGGASSDVASATLLLRTSAWGTNYVTTTMYSGGYIAFVASEDDTTLSLVPTVSFPATNAVAGATQGVPQKYTLGRGQVLQLATGEAPLSTAADLTGSVAVADKPVGSWGGHIGTTIPASAHSSDTGHQQIPPVQSLGASMWPSAFAADPRWRSRIPGGSSGRSMAPSSRTNRPRHRAPRLR